MVHGNDQIEFVSYDNTMTWITLSWSCYITSECTIFNIDLHRNRRSSGGSPRTRSRAHPSSPSRTRSRTKSEGGRDWERERDRQRDRDRMRERPERVRDRDRERLRDRERGGDRERGENRGSSRDQPQPAIEQAQRYDLVFLAVGVIP